MIEKKTEKENERKEKKSFGGRTGISKEEEKRTSNIPQRLIDTAVKKAKEPEKQKNASQMKALLMESNASREKSEKLQKRGHPSSGERNTGSSETVKGTTLTELICFIYVIFINLNYSRCVSQ